MPFGIAKKPGFSSPVGLRHDKISDLRDKSPGICVLALEHVLHVVLPGMLTPVQGRGSCPSTYKW